MFFVDLGPQSHYAVLGVSPNASTTEIRHARDRRVHALREQQRREPDRRDELVSQQMLVNAAGEALARPARRAEYDAANVHLRYFAVRSAAAPMFADPQARTWFVHRAIAAHLAATASALPPLSDLDRVAFDEDQTPNELLDELLRDGPLHPRRGPADDKQGSVP